MTQPPMQCLVCFRGNTPDGRDTLDDFWVLDLERDVNWGDPTYLCKYCCEKIAALTGFVPEADFAEQASIVRHQSRKIHNLLAKLEARDRRLDQIRVGEQAAAREKKKKSSKRAA